MTVSHVRVYGGGILALIAAVHAARRGIRTQLFLPAHRVPGSSWGYTRLVREDFNHPTGYLAAWARTLHEHNPAFRKCHVTYAGSTFPGALVDTVDLEHRLMQQIQADASIECLTEPPGDQRPAQGLGPDEPEDRVPTLVARGRGVLGTVAEPPVKLVHQDVLHVRTHDHAVPGFEPFVNRGTTWGMPGWGQCSQHAFSHVDLATPEGDEPPANLASLKRAVEDCASTTLDGSIHGSVWRRHHYVEAPHAPGRLVVSRRANVTTVVADGGGSFKRAPTLAETWLDNWTTPDQPPSPKEMIL